MSNLREFPSGELGVEMEQQDLERLLSGEVVEIQTERNKSIQIALNGVNVEAESEFDTVFLVSREKLSKILNRGEVNFHTIQNELVLWLGDIEKKVIQKLYNTLPWHEHLTT